MIAVIRLYRQHDMDLVTLYYNKSIHLCRLMKKVLVDYVNGDIIEGLEFEEPSTTEGYVPKCIRLHIHLNENNPREKAVCDLLQSMKQGYRCSFVKALFRNACTYLPMVGYTAGSAFLMQKIKSMPKVAEPVDIKPAEKPSTAEPEFKDNKESVPEPVVEEVKESEPVKESTESLDDLFKSFDKIG